MDYKTNVMRTLEQKKIPFVPHSYNSTEALSGMEVAEATRPKPAVKEQPISFKRFDKEMAEVVPLRPAGFCTGCPERPIFAALSLTQEKLGEHHIACDWHPGTVKTAWRHRRPIIHGSDAIRYSGGDCCH